MSASPFVPSKLGDRLQQVCKSPKQEQAQFKSVLNDIEKQIGGVVPLVQILIDKIDQSKKIELANYLCGVIPKHVMDKVDPDEQERVRQYERLVENDRNQQMIIDQLKEQRIELMMTREQQHDRINELEKSLNHLKNNLDHCQQSDQVNREFEDFER